MITDNSSGTKTDSRELRVDIDVPARLTALANAKNDNTKSKPRIIPNNKVAIENCALLLEIKNKRLIIAATK